MPNLTRKEVKRLRDNALRRCRRNYASWLVAHSSSPEERALSARVNRYSRLWKAYKVIYENMEEN